MAQPMSMAMLDASPMDYEMAAGEDDMDGMIGGAAMGLSLSSGTSVATGPKVRVVIRTNFAETSLWAPDLEAKKGKVSFGAVLPDSITTQTVTLIASDKKGRIGLLREKVDVAQDLYARSDLPATLTLGDEVEVTSAVRNFTKGTVKVKIGLKSDGLKIIGPSEQKLSVPEGGTGAAAFVIKPLRAGKVEYDVYVEGAGVKDVERREIYVHPAGLPTHIKAKGTVKRDKPFKAKVHLSGKDAHVEAFLNVSFPNAVPVIQGLESMVDKPGGAIDFISSNALVTAMAYQYLAAYGSNEDTLGHLRLRLQASLAALLMSQNGDGGWGWHVKLLRVDPSGGMGVDVPVSNPYMTAQTLEGLVEMKRAGLPVPEPNVRSALHSLSNSLGSDNLWSVKAIAFWEGGTNEVQLGVSAEIFRVMALACEAFPNLANDSTILASMNKLTGQFRPLIVDETMRDPLALSHAAMGVWTWAKLKNAANPYL